MGTVSAEPLGSQLYCTECGRRYPVDDLARFGPSTVCAECKPRFIQRMREGAAMPATFVYGGFWLRFVAVVLDGIILSIVTFPIQIATGTFMGRGLVRPQAGLAFGFLGVVWTISIAMNLAYQTYFVSQKGATPGKMIMGLKVITPNGGRVSVGRAAGRYFAQFLSGIIFCIGYIMAAFDSEKRALHDHICSTRVIRQV